MKSWKWFWINNLKFYINIVFIYLRFFVNTVLWSSPRVRPWTFKVSMCLGKLYPLILEYLKKFLSEGITFDMQINQSFWANIQFVKGFHPKLWRTKGRMGRFGHTVFKFSWPNKESWMFFMSYRFILFPLFTCY